MRTLHDLTGSGRLDDLTISNGLIRQNAQLPLIVKVAKGSNKGKKFNYTYDSI